MGSVQETSNRMITLFILLFISPMVRGFGICATFDRIIAVKPHKNFETAMPFLWKYCKKAKTPTDWCYENKLCGQYTWAKQYPTCAGSKQSPINIPLVSVYSASGLHQGQHGGGGGIQPRHEAQVPDPVLC